MPFGRYEINYGEVLKSWLENEIDIVVSTNPIREFIEKSVKKSEARPFKVPEKMTLMVVDPLTGEKAKFNSKNTIIETYKSKNVLNGKVLYSDNNRIDTNNILKFY